MTIAGSFQSELGCPGDWQPDCATTACADADGDGTWTGTFDVPAGELGVQGRARRRVGRVVRRRTAATSPCRWPPTGEVTFSYDARPTPSPTTPAGDGRTRLDPALLEMAKPEPARGPHRRALLLRAARPLRQRRPANDTGGLRATGSPTGYDPTDKGFYHGGDLKGLIDKLDYIEGLGTTAIWLAPVFKNRPVQGTGADASAGYHGYWITDFTQVDPHFGTNADLEKLIDEAHASAASRSSSTSSPTTPPTSSTYAGERVRLLGKGA